MAQIRKKRVKESKSGRRRGRQSDAGLYAIASASAAACLFVLYIVIGMLSSSRDAGGGGGRIPGARLGGGLQGGPGMPKNGAKNAARRDKEAAGGGRRGGGGGGGGDLLPMRRALEDPDWNPSATERARKILSASANLVSVSYGDRHSVRDDSYKGMIGHFCPLNFAAQKADPPGLPMFKDVVEKSGCDDFIMVDLKEAVELAREFDGDNKDGGLPTVLDLKGVVFHESRCGSTLAANSMMALNPDRHRVYSESSPPIAALRGCGEDYSECSIEAGANLLRDIVYMMARSDDSREENLFFKFQSINTRTMEVFRTAFPTTPWVFLYREPVEVLMSQLDVPRTSNANCVRGAQKSPVVHEFVDRTGYDMEDLTDEELCAAHLNTLCESALRNLEEDDGSLGMAVEYNPELVHDFLDVIFPKHFSVPVDGEGRERVMKISGTYSKNRGTKGDKFKPDSNAKERRASEAMRGAAEEFLRPSFDGLRQSERNIRPPVDDDRK